MSDTTKQIASFDPGRVLQDQVAAWTKERDRLQELIDTVSPAATPSPVPAEERVICESLGDLLMPKAQRDRILGAAPAEPASAELPPTIDTPAFRALFRNLISPDGEVWAAIVPYIDTKLRAALASRPAPVADVKEMVNRFLGWKLPDSVRQRLGLVNIGHYLGTTLLNANEARQMFEHCLAHPTTQPNEVSGQSAQEVKCPNGCTGPERGGAGCMAVTGECAMDSIAPAAPSAAQAAGVDKLYSAIMNLPRYTETADSCQGEGIADMIEDPSGEYVKLEDVRAALATTPSEGAAQAAGVFDVLREMASAMRRYQMDADTDAPQAHREMMARADAILATTPSEGVTAPVANGELLTPEQRAAIKAAVRKAYPNTLAWDLMLDSLAWNTEQACYVASSKAAPAQPSADQAASEAAVRDAARYRWIRQFGYQAHELIFHGDGTLMWTDDMDAAIDAATRASSEKGADRG